MNLSEIKSLPGDKPQRSPADAELKAKLQEEGLRQAARFQESHVSLSTNQSKTQIGIRILNASFNQTISIGENKPAFVAEEKKKESLFDFEEVAKNVLNFVGGAIRAAKQGGADDEKLNTMFEQATSGVLKGVEMARKDLAGFMNGEIEEGIQNSQKLIQEGIDKLRREIFEQPEPTEDGAVVFEGSASYSRSESGEIAITTRDGDQVTISFEDVRRIELNQQLISSTQVTSPPKPESKEQDDSVQQGAKNTKQEKAQAAEEAAQNEQTEKPQSESQVAYKESLSYFERSGLSFSLEGELDEGEMEAIADLVGDVKDLAESFFADDVEAAFNKALELGFNEQELSGYALQLNKTEQVQVIQAYGTVSHFDENQDKHEPVDPVKQIKPIADYLQDMMTVMEKSRELLLDDKQYENMVTGLMNKVLDLKTDDLVDAINQFNTFNGRLMQNIPQGQSLGEEVNKE